MLHLVLQFALLQHSLLPNDMLSNDLLLALRAMLQRLPV